LFQCRVISRCIQSKDGDSDVTHHKHSFKAVCAVIRRQFEYVPLASEAAAAGAAATPPPDGMDANLDKPKNTQIKRLA